MLYILKYTERVRASVRVGAKEAVKSGLKVEQLSKVYENEYCGNVYVCVCVNS